jgi:predicted Zn-dependent peptidase
VVLCCSTPAITGQKGSAPEVQVTKLGNGLTVASVDRKGAAASVGVYAKAGSRYDNLPGTSALLQQVAFYTTQKRSTAKLYRDVEDLGASISAHNGREVFSYNGSALRGNLDGLVGVLSEVVTQPKLWSWEVDEAKAVAAELNAEKAADPQNAVLEAVHAAAFGETSPLGHSRFASSDDLEGVSADTLRSFLGARFAANKMVIAATSELLNRCLGACQELVLSLLFSTFCVFFFSSCLFQTWTTTSSTTS